MKPVLRHRPDDQRPQLNGWAPGGYLNICIKCGWQFAGDKRAVKCAECAYALRHWVYDPKTNIPLWVVRKFHNISQGKLSSVAFGEAFPGDTIHMDPATGRYWVERKTR